MQQTIRWALSLSAAALLLTGCGGAVQNIDINNDKDAKAVMGLDYRDFQVAAQDMVQSLLNSGAVNKPGGGRYVLVVSRVLNDTMQHIDTDQLVKKMRVALLRSGKVVVTTAVGLNGAEDKMAMQTRKDLRGNEEFNQKTVAAKGQMIAPDLSLSGKIIQKNTKVDSSTQQTIYYFQLSLTDINTGLAFWEDEKVIGKRGSSDSAAW